MLAVHALDATVRTQRGGVGEITLRLGKADDCGGTPGAGRELLERLTTVRDERRTQQQVFGWVSRE